MTAFVLISWKDTVQPYGGTGKDGQLLCLLKEHKEQKKSRNFLRHRTHNTSFDKDFCLVGDLSHCITKGDPLCVILLFTPKPLKDPEVLKVPISLIWDFPFLY